MSSLHFYGTDFLLQIDEMPSDLVEDLRACSASGDAQEAVTHVMDSHEITGEVDNCREYLRGYGAWEGAELDDHHTNLERLVWLAGCDLSENGEIYFAAY